MWADLALSGISSLVKAGIGYQQATEEYESKKKWQAYNNAMTRIADAKNQNAVTTNEVMAKERAAIQRFNISRSTYITAGAAEASAAAAGTGGRSVNAVMFDIGRNAAMQRTEVEADLDAQFTQFDQQRENSKFQAVSNMDYSYLPKPNLATYALGISTDMLNSYTKIKYPKQS